MMDESKRTPRAVIWSAVLHVGLVGFLALTTLSCTTWEHVFSRLGLPKSLNPMTCTRPVSLKGPVIQATLVGVSAAPLAPVKDDKEKSLPPPPKPSKAEVKPEKPEPQPLETLAAPAEHPDTHNVQKVVADTKEKTKQAEHKQHEREKQHMAELEARKRQAKLDKIFQQLDQARQSREEAEKQSKREQQKLAQLKDLEKAKKDAPPQPQGVKQAEKKAKSGGNGTSTAVYKAAIQNAVTQAWLRPDNIPSGTVCPIHISQIPGGQVVSVTIDSSCPFGSAARRSVKNAVLRAQPLPYKGFEDAFSSRLTLNFKVKN